MKINITRVIVTVVLFILIMTQVYLVDINRTIIRTLYYNSKNTELLQQVIDILDRKITEIQKQMEAKDV